MGWYKNGEWNGLQVGEMRYVLSNLCCAINERETALGIDLYTGTGLTKFIVKDGVEKTYPTHQDFAGMLLTESAIGENINRMRDAIWRLCVCSHVSETWPVKIGGYRAKLMPPNWVDIHSVYTLLFYTGMNVVDETMAVWYHADRCHLSRIWIQMKEALRLLNTMLYIPSIVLTGTNDVHPDNYQDSHHAIGATWWDPEGTKAQEVWDDARTSPQDEFWTLQNRVGWAGNFRSYQGDVNAAIWRHATTVLNTTHVSGNIIQAQIKITVYAPQDLIGSVSFTVAGNDISTDDYVSGNYTEFMVPFEVNAGGYTTFQSVVNTDVPEDWPATFRHLNNDIYESAFSGCVQWTSGGIGYPDKVMWEKSTHIICDMTPVFQYH